MKKLSVHKKWIALALTILLGVTGAATVQAADNPDQDNWQFNLAPFYLWGVNIEGDMKAGPVSGSVDVPFSDVFDNLDAAFIVHFEGMHKSNWGFLVDVNYLDLESDLTLPMGVTQNIGLDLTLAEFAGLYRIQRDAHNFDVIFGLRYIEINNTVTLAGGPTLIDGSQDWLDPLIGGRWIYNFADGWSIIARADIGGFGVGSDFAWHALGLVEWKPFKNVSFLAGYRALDMDYEDGSGKDYFSYDATVHGPLLGVNFKW